MNRQQRRAGQSFHRKALKTAKFDEFEKEPDHKAKLAFFPKKYFKSFYKNSVISVQVYEGDDGIIVMGLRRHDQGTNVSWDWKQRTKNALFGESAGAIEVFPPEQELIDQANIYWLFVFTEVNAHKLGQMFNLRKYIS